MCLQKRIVIFAEGGKAMLQYPKDLQYDSHICVCQKPPTASASVTYTSSTIGSIYVVQTAFTAAWTWHKTFSPGLSLTQNKQLFRSLGKWAKVTKPDIVSKNQKGELAAMPLLWLFSSVQSLSRVRLFETPRTTACQTSLSITNSWSLLKLVSIESVMPFSHFILCHRLLLLPWIFPRIRVFSNESALRIRWPKYWSFSFNISPSNEYSGLIFFRMNWLDLLAVQETLKSLLQNHSSKASILWHSPFFIVKLSYPYMTTGKTIALTRQTFVDKVISLPFNMLSRLAITFLPRSKHLFIPWLQSASAVILEPPPKEVWYYFSIYLPWSDGTGCHDLRFLNVEL